MNVLFVHNHWPAQFVHLAKTLVAEGHRCIAIGSEIEGHVPGVEVARWRNRRGSTPGILPFATRAEADMIRGLAAAGEAKRLKEEGFYPDLIIGHPGWGETLFLREIYPRAKQLLHGEFFYRAEGGDAGFDPEFGRGTPSMDQRFQIHAKNAALSLALSDADQIVCPTQYQLGRLPPAFQARAKTIHEGIDTRKARKKHAPKFELAGGRTVTGESPIVTYASRYLEPLRGFHVFMRALPDILRRIPDAEVLVIGEEVTAGYGAAAPEGLTWKELLLRELAGKLDLSRVHFTGKVGHSRLIEAFSVSSAHVYYTYPFVLSWSLLEAMACECLIIGSNTRPLEDAVEHDRTGLLVDFFDVEALSDTIVAALQNPIRYCGMRRLARKSVLERFDLKTRCGPAWRALLCELSSDSV